MRKIKYHPLADLFPRIPVDDFRAMVQSIAKFGQKQKIILFEGKILDGRHRYEACLEAGVKPQFEEYKGDDPIGYVEAVNFHRRHMDSSQRAAVAYSLETTTWGGNRKKSQENGVKNQDANLRLDPEHTRAENAERYNVSERSINSAGQIAKQSPELFEKVKQGEITVNAALNELKQEEKSEEESDVVDETGWPVPKSLRVYWDRRGELLEIMKKIASIANHLEERWREGDEFYKRTRSQDAIIKLNDAHRYIRASQLYAVCPTCNGRNMKACTLCKGAGILTKHLWQQCVPEETKRMRERQINLAKQKGKA